MPVILRLLGNKESFYKMNCSNKPAKKNGTVCRFFIFTDHSERTPRIWM